MYQPGVGQPYGMPMAQQWSQQPAAAADPTMTLENESETDNARRPPNAFILYSQAMRSAVRQENPSLSNTEVSSLLGKMWKEVPSDVKMQYKQRAAQAQEEFKRQHPDYTYRKARRKRALNELLTKSTQGFGPGFAADPSMMMGMGNPSQFQMMQAMAYGQGPMPGMPIGQLPGQAGQPGLGQSPMGMPGQNMGMPGIPGQMGIPGQSSYGMMDPSASMYSPYAPVPGK